MKKKNSTKKNTCHEWLQIYKNEEEKKKQKNNIMENIIFSKFLTNEWKKLNCLNSASPCKVKTLKSTNHKLKTKTKKKNEAKNNNTKITLERHTIINIT